LLNKDVNGFETLIDHREMCTENDIINIRSVVSNVIDVDCENDYLNLRLTTDELTCYKLYYIGHIRSTWHYMNIGQMWVKYR